ncbi:hypothetical protein ACFL3C_04875 [Patescibacteria group bacterium]
MDNPLNIKPPQDDAVVKPSKKTKRRRKGLGLPAILSIFGGILIVGAVVGTLIYSQSPDRLTGSLMRAPVTFDQQVGSDLKSVDATRSAGTFTTFDSSVATTTCPEGLDLTSTTDPTTGAALNLCICPDMYYPVITAGATGAQSLTTGFSGTATSIKCEPFVCGMTQEEVAKAGEDYGTLLTLQGVSESLVSTLKTKLVSAYETWEDKNPACQPAKPCPDMEFFLDRTNQCYSLCDLPEQYYNSVSVLQNAYNSDRTDPDVKDELKQIIDSASSGVSYSTWYANTCEEKTIEKRPTKTCDDVMKELQEAYAKKDKDAYAAALATLIENNCITECDENFFMAIYSIVNPAFLSNSASSLSFATANSSPAENYIIKYLEGSCTDCDKTYGLITLYALELSTQDNADLSLLEKLLQVFLKNCQCVELETLLDSPSFDANDYFNVTAVPGNTAIKAGTLELTDSFKSAASSSQLNSASSFSTLEKSTSNTTNTAIDITKKATDTSDAVINLVEKDTSSTFTTRYINSLLFEEAYAQTRINSNVSTGLSEDVRALIESMYDDSECGEEEKVPECKDLDIVSPTTNSAMTVTGDFDPDDDILEIQVSGADAVQEYKYSTSDNDLELVDMSDDLKKGLKGGPAPGQSIAIDVVAIDAAGNELKQCTDRLTVSRDKPKDDGGPTPKVCKSLKITKPVDAQDGSVTLDAAGYDDETLLIEVVDEGEVVDYRFTSVNDNDKITFNGEQTLDTTNTAIKLSADLDAGDEYIVTVWARGEDDAGNLVGLGDCHDSFTIKRPSTPTDTPDDPPEDPPTTTTISQGDPEPETEELEIPEVEVTQPTSAPEPTTEPVQVEELHAAAPMVPKSGPAALIYLVGAGLGGVLVTRRRKK